MLGALEPRYEVPTTWGYSVPGTAYETAGTVQGTYSPPDTSSQTEPDKEFGVLRGSWVVLGRVISPLMGVLRNVTLPI